MKDAHLASSYRRMFRLATKDMPNWKTAITVVVNSDDMRGVTNQRRIQRAVKRMQRINTAIMFMVGGPNVIQIHQNSDSMGRTIVLRNAGYYVNIGA